MYAKNLIDAFNRFSDRAFDAMLLTLVFVALFPGLVYLRVAYGRGQKVRANLRIVGSASALAWAVMFGVWITYG